MPAAPLHASASSTGATSQSTSRAVSGFNQGQAQRNTNERLSPPKAEATNSGSAVTNRKQSLFDDEESWNLQLIASKSPEYEDIRRRCRGFHIEAVYAVRNEMIEQRYMDAVAQTLEHETFKAFHSVWHGTTADEAIVRTGFGVGGVDVKRKHGSAMGFGVYVTTQANQAATYSTRDRTQSMFRMLFCELCETTDTIVQPGSQVFVQPNRRLVRPIYVLHFSQFGKKLRRNTRTGGPNLTPSGMNPNPVIAKATNNSQPPAPTAGGVIPSTNGGVTGNNQNGVQPNVTRSANGNNTLGPVHSVTISAKNPTLTGRITAASNSSECNDGNRNANASASSHHNLTANTGNPPRSSPSASGPSNVNEVTPMALTPSSNPSGAQTARAGTNAHDNGKLNLNSGPNTSAMPNGYAVPSGSNARKPGASEIRTIRNNLTARWVERDGEIDALGCSNSRAPPVDATNTSPASINKNKSLFDDEESWNLQLISSKSPEYDDIRKRCPQLKIEAVYAVRNRMIEERYMDAVAETLENETFKAFHSVWHGTRADDDIVRTGFGVGGVDVERKHGSAMGVGVYVTTQPTKAVYYSQKYTRIGEQFFRMIFCDLCETTDTIVRADRHIFVQPNKCLVRPLFVIHFRD